MSPRRSRPNGSLEREVIACLATVVEAMTAREVQVALGGSLAYSTVLTTLTRLYEKQALTRVPRGRAYAYQLAGGPQGALASVTAHQMQRLLDAGTDRASVLSRFVDTLDPESGALLRDLLNHADANEPDPGARQ